MPFTYLKINVYEQTEHIDNNDVCLEQWKT